MLEYTAARSTCTVPTNHFFQCIAGSPKIYVNLSYQWLLQFLLLLCSGANSNYYYYSYYYSVYNTAAYQALTLFLVSFTFLLVCSFMHQTSQVVARTRPALLQLTARIQRQIDQVRDTCASLVAGWSSAGHDRIAIRTCVVAF